MAYPDAVHFLVQSALNSEKAWRTATTHGTTHLQTLVNSLATLQTPPQLNTSTSTSPSSPPPHALLTTHTTATVSLKHLHTTLRRLDAILTGLRRWISEPAFPCCIYAQLHTFASSFEQALAIDLVAKRRAVYTVVSAIAAGGGLSDQSATVVLAEWSELCALAGSTLNAATLSAVADATALMLASSRVESPRGASSTPQSLPMASSRMLSPALAMLTSDTRRPSSHR